MPREDEEVSSPLRAAAARVVELVSEGQGDAREVGLLMDGLLGRWMDGIFRRLGVPEAEAEELTMDVWVKLLGRQYEPRGSALALLRSMAHSRFADYVRGRHAGKRTLQGGHAEVSGDDDFWDVVLDTVPGPEEMLWLRDCLERMFVAFGQKSPQRAELLAMVAERMSYREIACVLFDIDEAEAERDRKWEQRVRNRIEEARKQAAPYFEQCKD